MARRYAVMLGLVAFAAALTRGTIEGGSWEATVGHALACLWLYALLGAILGWVGQVTVHDSVRARMAEELERQATPDPQRGPAGLRSEPV